MAHCKGLLTHDRTQRSRNQRLRRGDPMGRPVGFAFPYRGDRTGRPCGITDNINPVHVVRGVIGDVRSDALQIGVVVDDVIVEAFPPASRGDVNGHSERVPPSVGTFN